MYLKFKKKCVYVSAVPAELALFQQIDCPVYAHVDIEVIKALVKNH